MIIGFQLLRSPMTSLLLYALFPRACLKIHSWHLHAPLRGIFVPNSLNAAHCAAFIWHKSPTKWHAQLPESNFQTRSRVKRKELTSFTIKTINEQQAARIREQEETIRELRVLKANLEETIGEFRRKFFGVRSEKASPSSEDPEQEAVGEKIKVKSHTRERKKKAVRGDLYAALPVREIRCPVSEEEKNCPYCNAPMEPLGYRFVREELRITPARVERVRYLQETVIYPECKKDGDGCMNNSF